MFGSSRRHRPPAQPLTKETANPNAATAAASAFMRRDPPSLSSAAAAAALKARPTTPTNVSEVQSKRAHRRSPSVGSTASRDRNSRRELQRSPSVSSMMERTFRSPSPGRSPAPRHHEVHHDAPPVPSLPNHDQLRAKTKSPSSPQQRKAPTLQTQQFRTASQKLKDGQQGGSWFGAAAANDGSNVRTSDAVLRSAAASPPLEDRPGSPSPSINFSYPRAGVDSPVRPRSTSGTELTMIYDPNSRRMVPRQDPTPRQDVVDRPVAKKKQDVSRSGSHLSKGTVARTKAPALETAQVSTFQSAPAPSVSTPEPKPKQSVVYESTPAVTREDTLVDPDATHEEPAKLDLRESDGATVLPPTDSVETPVTVQGKQVLEEQKQQNQDAGPVTFPEAVDAVPLKTSSAAIPDSQDKPADIHQSPEEAGDLMDEKVNPAVTRYDSIRHARVPSESPARSAHFASTPDQLAIKHEPPPRSLSPRKSAMKGSQARGASPSDDDSEASGSANLGLPEESASARKKRFRVSFDDQKTVVLGEAAPKPETDSPIIPSPQAVKKPWHSIVGRYNNKKDAVPLEENETMTPRPALPLFGSVREKKPRETEERPLVRPTERAWSPLPSSADPVDSPGEDIGQSNDVAIGSILASEQSSKNEANISKYREPLPPVVTSLEGSGYVSHSDLSSDDELEDAIEDAPAEPALTPVPEATEGAVSESPKEVFNDAAIDQEGISEAEDAQSNTVPNIAITQPSPLAQLEEKSTAEPRKEYFGIPGGFPDEEDSSETSPSPVTANNVTEPLASVVKSEDVAPPKPAEAAPQEPEPVTPVRNVEPVPDDIPATVMTDIQEEEEEEPTDGDSIYSDAYEDLSDVEGDGFLSLDAVLTTPVKAKVSQMLFEKAKLQADENKFQETPTGTNESQAPPIQTQDDWDRAKAYWRSLTTDKRRQLELEALEEAGEEADLEGEQKPKRRSKRRSVNSSIDVTAPVTAAVPAEPAKTQKPVQQDRVYQIQPGTKAAFVEAPPQVTASQGSGTGKLRKSMRGAAPPPDQSLNQPQAGGMRKSLRSGGPAARAEPEAPSLGMRKSLRSNGSAGDSLGQRPSIKTSNRPASYQPPPTAVVAEDPKRNRSADPRRPVSSSAMKSTMRRRGSDSSESSFTRVRAAKGASGFGFRTSMRGSMRETAPGPEATKGSGRFSLRSLSPTGSTFRRNSFQTQPPPTANKGGMMRQSLRSSSSDAGTSRKRFSGLSLSSNKKEKPKSKANRFADSSDDEDVPTTFRSRFADSSDEEEEAPRPQSMGKGMASRSMRANPSSSSAAAAAMGVPATRVRSESPDLPDSDDDIVPPRRPATSGGAPVGQSGPGLQRSRSGRGTLVTSPAPGAIGTQGIGSNRPANQRRGSFMSILRRKKDPAGKISREITESAARRDTKLERSQEQLSMMRSNSNSRLQKRGPNWPLPDEATGEEEAADNTTVPETAEVDEEKRPSTAGGPASAAPPRSAFLRRRSTSYSVAVSATPDDTAGSNKKKKFGALRKMFKLSD